MHIYIYIYIYKEYKQETIVVSMKNIQSLLDEFWYSF